MPPRLHGRLELTPEQRKELNALDKDMAGQLDKILTDDQKKQAAGDEPGSGPPPDEPGQIVPASMRTRLKLTDAQQKQVAALQKEAEGKLDKLLDEKQRKQFKGMRDKDKGPASRRAARPAGRRIRPAGRRRDLPRHALPRRLRRAERPRAEAGQDDRGDGGSAKPKEK